MNVALKPLKHTPGPWTVTEGKLSLQIHSIGKDGKREYWLANIKGESVPASEMGNAHLIAAAPELLEALKQVRDWEQANPGSISSLIEEDANAAIAKAEGRS